MAKHSFGLNAVLLGLERALPVYAELVKQSTSMDAAIIFRMALPIDPGPDKAMYAVIWYILHGSVSNRDISLQIDQ